MRSTSIRRCRPPPSSPSRTINGAKRRAPSSSSSRAVRRRPKTSSPGAARIPAAYKCPRYVVFTELPKTSTGKVQKFKLREMAKDV